MKVYQEDSNRIWCTIHNVSWQRAH